MLNIPTYEEYNGEKKIALMDNSAIAFMEQVERRGVSVKELLQGYDVVLLPNWVMEEVKDSTYRENFVEKLLEKGIPIYTVAEEKYSDLANNEEETLYKIVCAAVSKLGVMKSYLQKNVWRVDALDMDEYRTWINEMYRDWPLSSTNTAGGRVKKKNAGEISLTILAEVFS